MTHAASAGLSVEQLRARDIHEPDGSGWFDPAQEYRFNREAADMASEFFRRFLVHTEGQIAGRPFMLEPWQAERIVRPMFGWQRMSSLPDGTRAWTRKYRSAMVMIPRKNGKSTLAAGIALKLTFSDHEPGAQVYSTGADRDQARLVFDCALRMRASNDQLRRRSLAYKQALTVPQIGASYKVLSADAGTKHGLNTHGVINDEVHAHKSRDLYDVMHTSMSARSQPLEFNITTAGHDRESIAYELFDYATKVADGIVHDDTFLPVLYGAGREDDWTDPEVWARANPNLGISKSLDYMRTQCKRAQEVPGYENTFKQLELNIWTEQATRWLPMNAWDECGARFDIHELDGAECWGGLDLSSTTDISSLALVFRVEHTVRVLVWFWVPEDNIRMRAQRDHVPYDVWVRDGYIKATPGNVVDQDQIRADINALGKRFRIRELAVDRWNTAQLMTQLAGDGFTVVAFGQGFASMSAPSKEIERLVVGRQLRHNANPVLRWMAANVSAQIDPAGNVKPNKAKSTGRIDGIVASIMGIGRMIVHREEETVTPAIILL
jgi:phage terminase large subunit-like protein